MIRRSINPRARWVLMALSVLVMVAIYSWLSYRQHRINPDDSTLPGWSQMAEGVHDSVTPHHRSGDIRLLDDSKATLGRLAAGTGIGIGVAVLLGFLMGCWGPAEAFLTGPVRIFAKLNPIAMLAIFFVLTDGEWLFISMIAFGITPVLTMNIFLAVKNDVPEQLIHKAYTLGASTMEIVVSVIGRQVLPKVIEGVRLLIGPALVYLIAAEMVVGSVGFGYTVRIQMRLLNMEVVYPYIAILAVFGFAIDQGLHLLLHRLCPWYVERSN